MTIATGSKTTLHYVAESTYGTTPATPVFKPLCITGTSQGMTKDSLEAGKLTSDRQVTDLRHGNKQVGGEVTAELSYGDFDDMLEAMAMGTWAANVLKAGVTRRSFTFERYFDVDTDEYHRFLGMEVNTMSLTVAPNSMAEITFGFVGQDLTLNTTQVAGATYDAVSGNRPFDSFSGSINEGGSAIATVTEVSLNWDNGIEPAFVIGDAKTIRPADGKSRLTGTLTAFFEDKSLYEKFINETSSSIDFTLTDQASSSLKFDMNNVKYTAGNPDVAGEGQITLPLEFTAVYDSSDASQIVITRTP